MADINLLPEDLRDKEAKARQQAQPEAQALRFSKPHEPANASVEGQAPGRWRQLMSALKKNVSSPAIPVVKPVSPLPPSSSPAASSEQARLSMGPSTATNKVAETADKLTAETKPSAVPEYEPKAKPAVKAPVTSTAPQMPEPTPTLLDVNLIPAQESKSISRQQVVWLTSLAAAAMVLVLVVYVSLRYFFAQKQSENKSMEQEIIVLQEQLESVRAKAEQAITTQKRIAMLDDQLKNSSHWQAFFKLLETNTIPTVVFNNLAADASGSISLAGQAPNMTEVGRQMLAFEQVPQVIDVVLGDVTLETSRSGGAATSYIRFSLSLKVEPRLFTANKDEN